MANETFAPTPDSQRIATMDLLRGSALLGIALMNIVFSALPLAAHHNLKLAGGSTGPNVAVFLLEYILFDGKMRGLFSIMFGAGAYLFVNRLDGKAAGLQAAEIFYRRLLWLLVFGIVHAYLIWHGDILYPYAIIGLILLPLFRLSPRTLLIVAAVVTVLDTGESVRGRFSLLKTKHIYEEAVKAESAHKTLTDEQKTGKAEWEAFKKQSSPSSEELKKEREMYSGSYLHLVAKRAEVVMKWHSVPFYLQLTDMFPMMLIGIAFLKLGVLAGDRSTGFYIKTLLVAYAIGLPIGSYAAFTAWGNGFDPVLNIFTFSTYQIARVAMTIGHMSLLILFHRSGWLPSLQAALSSIGKTAFSNYILHSLIYGFVFYGYGFNLFGKLERYQIYYVVAGMWTVSLIVSPLWLKAYRYGPLEWCWRSLTYWKRQPMRLEIVT